MGASITRRLTAVAGLAAVISLSACSLPQAGSAAEATATMTETAAPSATVGPSVPGGKVIQSDIGDYLQSAITDDDPAMVYDPLVVEPSTHELVPLEQQEEAWRFAVRFLAVDVLDSPINGGAGTVDSWWNEHKDYFDPVYQEAIRGDFDGEDGHGPLMRAKFDAAFHFVQSPLETRLSDRSIKVDQMYYANNAMHVFNITFSGTFKVSTPDGPSSEPFQGTYVFGLIPSETNGYGWSISHYDLDYRWGTADEVLGHQ